MESETEYDTDKTVCHPAAIESDASSGIFGALSCPIGMTRRNISYDELMEAPMHSPPSDMSVNILWKDPVIPQHRFRNTTEVHSCLSAAEFATCIQGNSHWGSGKSLCTPVCWFVM